LGSDGKTWGAYTTFTTGSTGKTSNAYTINDEYAGGYASTPAINARIGKGP